MIYTVIVASQEDMTIKIEMNLVCLRILVSKIISLKMEEVPFRVLVINREKCSLALSWLVDIYKGCFN